MPISELSVDVERKPGSLAVLRVEAPPDDVQAAVSDSLRRLASRVRVPGFRPGKAPAAMVERAVGWDAVRRETVEHLVPELYARALEQTGVEAVGDPELDVGELERDQPLVFSATVTVRPDVHLGDYLSIRVEEPATEVSDDQVDEAIEEVRRRHAELREVERPAQAGDVLRCTLVMRNGDQLLSAEEAGERDLELDRESLIPGIVDGIIGLSAGDSRTFDVTLPDDYRREELRGSTVTVDVTVHAVREQELPPLDDSLAAVDGHGSTLEELRAHYRERLEAAANEADRARFEGDALRALRDVVTVDLPEVMVDREIERELADLEYRLASLGLTLDKYLELSGQTVEKLRGERRESAAQRVKLDLALDALAAAEQLEVDESQVNREATRLAERRQLTAAQRRRLRDIARRDLRRRAAGQRLLEIVREEFVAT